MVPAEWIYAQNDVIAAATDRNDTYTLLLRLHGETAVAKKPAARRGDGDRFNNNGDVVVRLRRDSIFSYTDQTQLAPSGSNLI